MLKQLLKRERWGMRRPGKPESLEQAQGSSHALSARSALGQVTCGRSNLSFSFFPGLVLV